MKKLDVPLLILLDAIFVLLIPVVIMLSELATITIVDLLIPGFLKIEVETLFGIMLGVCIIGGLILAVTYTPKWHRWVKAKLLQVP